MSTDTTTRVGVAVAIYEDAAMTWLAPTAG